MQDIKQKMKDEENQKLQKIQEEENEENLRQDAISLLSNEMRKEYEAKMKDLESNISSTGAQDQEYENGNKRKWSSDENVINTSEININDNNNNHSNNHSRHDTSDSLRQSQLLNNRVDQEKIIDQVTKNIISRSESQSNLNKASTSIENTNIINSETNVENNSNGSNNNTMNTVNNINNNDDNIPSTSAVPVNNSDEGVSNGIKEINLDKDSISNHQANNEPALMNIEVLDDKVDTISIALDDQGEFQLKGDHQSSSASLNKDRNNASTSNNNNNITNNDNVNDNNATFEPLISLSPFQLPPSPQPPQPPQSQPEIINPFNLYFGFKKSTGIFGNLISTTAVSNNDDLIKNISSQMADLLPNQKEINNSNPYMDNIPSNGNKGNNTINDTSINKDNTIINSPKSRIATSTPKIQFNISSNNSTVGSEKPNNNNSRSKLKNAKAKKHQNLHKLNVITMDSGDEISMIGDSEPEESSLGYSLNQSLRLLNDHKSIDYSTDKASPKYEKRTKETQDPNNIDVLNDSEITKKAKQNAKDSLLKFIPKIIDENINTNELKLFKYNFDNFDFSNIILMNNYLNNAKQINNLQTKLQQEQQQQSPGPSSENQRNSKDSLLNSSLNENYEISAPFSSIFEHTVIYAITKQNEIIDFSVMNYFMTNLEFVQQLKSLSSFYLLNDGNYVCQLKSILFDSKNGINVLKVNNPLKLNFNLIVNNLNCNSLITSSSSNFLFTNNNKVTSDNKNKTK
ncbi:hypothetical protein PIROE2DRAFT_20915 [Piromyces sp. E2]|nr:hypothetical protein PIROE2DRAFT_20915 [Piromyces sp. E2]|eukprot:OUM61654.1 hypothetical protein PIROE2DRAFT_20915 [Piromyces sp. E2]